LVWFGWDVEAGGGGGRRRVVGGGRRRVGRQMDVNGGVRKGWGGGFLCGAVLGLGAFLGWGRQLRADW
jgi:hypothetical protein